VSPTLRLVRGVGREFVEPCSRRGNRECSVARYSAAALRHRDIHSFLRRREGEQRRVELMTGEPGGLARPRLESVRGSLEPSRDGLFQYGGPGERASTRAVDTDARLLCRKRDQARAQTLDACVHRLQGEPARNSGVRLWTRASHRRAARRTAKKTGTTRDEQRHTHDARSEPATPREHHARMTLWKPCLLPGRSRLFVLYVCYAGSMGVPSNEIFHDCPPATLDTTFGGGVTAAQGPLKP
jgi:hypothetical protein